ncbi:MAG: hypothetical protein IJJ03_07680, partial [Mogibacterium sp.]|nr:hypothetical protein [Mogibacterium sp.]
ATARLYHKSNSLFITFTLIFTFSLFDTSFAGCYDWLREIYSNSDKPGADRRPLRSLSETTKSTVDVPAGNCTLL